MVRSHAEEVSFLSCSHVSHGPRWCRAGECVCVHSGTEQWLCMRAAFTGPHERLRAPRMSAGCPSPKLGPVPGKGRRLSNQAVCPLRPTRIRWKASHEEEASQSLAGGSHFHRAALQIGKRMNLDVYFFFNVMM